VAREVLEFACSLAVAGRSTDSIDAEVHAAILRRNVYPAPLNYRGFPKSLCAAVNEEICHGIPNDRPLENGDIAKFDVSIYVSYLCGSFVRSFVRSLINAVAR
jgi:methionyl aminopeptidase